MGKVEPNSFAAALRRKAAELEAALRRRDGLEAEILPDIFDQVQSAAEREVVVETLDCISSQLAEVRAAMERLRGGEFGQCLSCGEQIGRKRLEAIPWAALCLECQEMADRQEPRRLTARAAASPDRSPVHEPRLPWAA